MLIFKHNFFIDIRAISATILRKSWLDRKGYIYYLLTIDKDKYGKIDYNKLANELSQELKRYGDLFNDDDYIILLTKYGVYGSYYLPNKIFINIQRDIKDIVATIIHEIIHLRVEDIVKQKRLNHEEKEELVEDMLKEFTAKDRQKKEM